MELFALIDISIRWHRKWNPAHALIIQDKSVFSRAFGLEIVPSASRTPARTEGQVFGKVSFELFFIQQDRGKREMSHISIPEFVRLSFPDLLTIRICQTPQRK